MNVEYVIDKYWFRKAVRFEGYRWSIECYHYETHTYTEQDSEGRTVTRTETVKVVTHTNSHFWSVSHCHDASDALPVELAEDPIVLLSFEEAQLRWLTPAAESGYESEKAQWIREKDRDTHKDFSEGGSWNGDPSRVVRLALGRGARVPWFLCYPNFVLGSLLLASAPLRAALKARSSRACVGIVKVIA